MVYGEGQARYERQWTCGSERNDTRSYFSCQICAVHISSILQEGNSSAYDNQNTMQDHELIILNTVYCFNAVQITVTAKASW